MPIPRQNLRARAGWTDEHIAVLVNGHDWFGAFRFDGPIGHAVRDREGWDESAEMECKLQRCINDVGDEVLADFIAKHPGHRPWFWWRFVAVEMRRCLNGPPRYSRPEYVGVPRRYRMGVPSLCLPPDWGHGEVYESQTSYLARLNLLTIKERELLAK